MKNKLQKLFNTKNVWAPFGQAAYIADRNGKLIGYFNEIVMLYETYEYHERAKQVLDENDMEFEIVEKDRLEQTGELEIITDIPFI